MGIEGPQWPWIVRRPLLETTGTMAILSDDGVFWQVISEGTDGGNGPHGVPGQKSSPGESRPSWMRLYTK